MNITYIVVSVAIVAALTTTYLVIKRKPKQKTLLPKNYQMEIPSENIVTKECEITMIEVVNWFKNQRLDPNKHTPFIASQEMLMSISPSLDIPAEKQALFMGVLNEKTSEVEFFCVMYGESFSVDLKSTLGSEQLIVLS